MRERHAQQVCLQIEEPLLVSRDPDDSSKHEPDLFYLPRRPGMRVRNFEIGNAEGGASYCQRNNRALPHWIDTSARGPRWDIFFYFCQHFMLLSILYIFISVRFGLRGSPSELDECKTWGPGLPQCDERQSNLSIHHRQSIFEPSRQRGPGKNPTQDVSDHGK